MYSLPAYSYHLHSDYGTCLPAPKPPAWKSLSLHRNLVRGAMAMSLKNSPDFNRPVTLPRAQREFFWAGKCKDRMPKPQNPTFELLPNIPNPNPTPPNPEP